MLSLWPSTDLWGSHVGPERPLRRLLQLLLRDDVIALLLLLLVVQTHLDEVGLQGGQVRGGGEGAAVVLDTVGAETA